MFWQFLEIFLGNIVELSPSFLILCRGFKSADIYNVSISAKEVNNDTFTDLEMETSQDGDRNCSAPLLNTNEAFDKVIKVSYSWTDENIRLGCVTDPMQPILLHLTFRIPNRLRNLDAIPSVPSTASAMRISESAVATTGGMATTHVPWR